MAYASGERHYAAKLTKAKVLGIRMLHNTPCEHCGQRLTIRALARMYGVAKATVGHAITGRNWDLPGFASVGRNPEGRDGTARCEASQSGGKAASPGRYRDTPTEAVTDEQLEAGADAYHDAVVRAQTARQQRNDIHEAAGRGRIAPEDSIFPIDWLEPVYIAMQAARSETPEDTK